MMIKSGRISSVRSACISLLAPNAFALGLLAGCTGGGVSTSATAGESNDNGVCESGEKGWPDCPGTYMFQCQNDNLINYHTDIYGGKHYDDPYQGCAVIDQGAIASPDGVDGWKALAKQACSGHCESISHQEYQCGAGNWTDVDYAYPCTEPTALLDLGPVLALLGQAAATAASQLPCDLGFDCADLLDKLANEAMWTPPDEFVRYTADVLTEATSATVQLMGNPDEELVGQAAFTANVCGAAACPFYLAQMDLGALSAIRVPMTIDGTPVVKFVDGLSIRLDEPALGMWLPGSGNVIFPPDSLRVRVSARVSGEPNVVGENGGYDNVYHLENYVFGSLDADELTISANGQDVLGTWSITAVFDPIAPQ